MSVRVNRIHRYGRTTRKYFYELPAVDATPVVRYSKPQPSPPRTLTPLDHAVAQAYARLSLNRTIAARCEHYSKAKQWKSYDLVLLECSPKPTAGTIAERIVKRHEQYAKSGVHKSYDEIRLELS